MIDPAAPPPPARSLRSAGLVLLLCAVAAALRFYKLGEKNLWIDEGTSVTLVRMPWGEFLRTVWGYEGNMSLYYLLLRGWVLLGDSEIVLRLPSVLLGVATVPMMYVLGRRFWGERTGLLAAALLALNMFHVSFSQYARAYTLLILLVTISTWALVRALERPERRAFWILHVAAGAAAVYSHFFAALVPIGQWLGLGRRWRAAGLPRLVAIALGPGVLIVPAILFVFTKDQGQLSWMTATTAGAVLFVFLMLSGLNPLLALLTLAGVVRGVRALRRGDDDAFGLHLFASSFIVPIVIVLLASFVKPLFFPAYLSICLPAGLLLAARVLTPRQVLSRARNVVLGLVIALTLGLSLLVTASYFQNFLNLGGDFRAATEYILARRQEGDALVIYHSAGLDPYRYYIDRVPSRATPLPVPEILFPAAGQLASAQLKPTDPGLPAAARRHRRLWLLLHQKKVEDLPPGMLAPFRLVEQQQYNGIAPELGVIVALYELK